MAKLGDEWARDRIAKRYFRAIMKYAWELHHRTNGAIDLDEAQSNMGYALSKAIVRYDPTKGFAFSTYVLSILANTVKDGMRELANRKAIRGSGTLRPEMVPMGPEVTDMFEDPADAAQPMIVEEITRLATRAMTDEQKIAFAILADDGSQADVARKLGVSEQKCRRLVVKTREMAALGLFAAGMEV